jgi:hypothetical protein
VKKTLHSEREEKFSAHPKWVERFLEGKRTLSTKSIES